VNDELPTLVITGASSGIGLALAKKLATLTDRYRIVLSAREQSMPALKNSSMD
jgi:short-subunit dehydrogenase